MIKLKEMLEADAPEETPQQDVPTNTALIHKKFYIPETGQSLTTKDLLKNLISDNQRSVINSIGLLSKLLTKPEHTDEEREMINTHASNFRRYITTGTPENIRINKLLSLLDEYTNGNSEN